MLGELLANSYMYLFGAVAIGFIGYNIWSGIKGSNEEAQFVFEKLSELFEKRPESFVIRSLSAPGSSTVGSHVGDRPTPAMLSSSAIRLRASSRWPDRAAGVRWNTG